MTLRIAIDWKRQIQLHDLLTVNFNMKFLISEKWIVQNLVSKQVL